MPWMHAFAALAWLAGCADPPSANPGEVSAAAVVERRTVDGAWEHLGPRWDLGTSEVGQTLSGTLRVRAASAQDVSVLGVSATPEDVWRVQAPLPWPAQLSGRSAIAVTVTAEPSSACAAEGELVVRLGDPLVTHRFALSAAFVGGGEAASDVRLEVASPPGSATARPLEEGATAAFGAVGADRVKALTFILGNDGECALQFLALDLEGDDAFFVVGAPDLGTVGPASERAFQIGFAPRPGAAASAREATLRLRTQRGVRLVRLSGLAGQSGLEVTPEGVDFGTVTVGASVTQRVRILNVGEGVATVTGLDVAGADFDLGGTLDGGRISLGPGTAASVDVSFSPASARVSEGGLTVQSAAGSRLVALSGAGIAGSPRLDVEATEGGAFEAVGLGDVVDFGTGDPGDDIARRFRVTNDGTGPLRVDGLTVGFGFTVLAPPLPLRLAPGEQAAFRVRFEPMASTASYASALLIATDSGSGSVALTGSLRLVCGSTVRAPDTGPPCAPGAGVMCLHGGRFAVTAAWQALDCQTDVASVRQLGPDAGILSLSEQGPWELLVAIDDHCASTGHYGFRAASVSRDRVELRVTDLVSGAVRTWFSPLGTSFGTIDEPDAWVGCPDPQQP